MKKNLITSIYCYALLAGILLSCAKKAESPASQPAELSTTTESYSTTSEVLAIMDSTLSSGKYNDSSLSVVLQTAIDNFGLQAKSRTSGGDMDDTWWSQLEPESDTAVFKIPSHPVPFKVAFTELNQQPDNKPLGIIYSFSIAQVGKVSLSIQFMPCFDDPFMAHLFYKGGDFPGCGGFFTE